MQQSLARVALQVDADLRIVFHVLDDAVEELTEVLGAGEAEFEDRDVLGQFRRDVHLGGDDDDRLVRVTHMMRDIAQFADHRQVAAFSRRERMKILEQIDRRFDLIDHGIECRDRIGRAVAASFGSSRLGAGSDQPLRDRPHEQFLVARLRDLPQAAFDSLLLPTDHVHDRIACANEYIKFLLR